MAYSKFIVSGNTIETYIYENDLPIRRTYRRKKKKSYIKAGYFRADNLYRKKRLFVKLVRSNLSRDNSPAFISLTMLYTLTVQQAYKCFSDFIGRLRIRFGKDFRYISVPEFQKRGAIHFHALIWDLPTKEILNERNTRHFQHLWQRGFVDCIVTDGNEKLATYLGKYLHKTQTDRRLLGQKAYVCSRNIKRPRVLPFAEAVMFSKEIWGLDLSTEKPLLEKEFKSQWLGYGRYKLYKF